MTSPIISNYIQGIPMPKDEYALLCKRAKFPKHHRPDEITTAVFQVLVDGEARYCCWSGGALQAAPDHPDALPIGLTDAGLIAFKQMRRLPFFQHKIAFIELRLGQTPIREKVLRAFRTTPTDMMLCFFGDLAKELDGHMHLAFNVQGLITVKDCIGIRPSVSEQVQ